MSATTDHILDNLRVSLPGSVDGNTLMELFNTVDEFCKRTLVWQQDVTVSVEADVKTYDVAPEGSAQIIQMLSLIDDEERAVVGRLLNPTTLILRDAPSAAADWTLKVVCTIKQPEKSDGWPFMPDWLLDRFTTVIMDGVKGRMHAQPAKPYSSAQMAVMYGRKFAADCANIRFEVMNGFGYDTQLWRFNAFTGRPR